MQVLQSHLNDECYGIHNNRLQAVIDVASALNKSQNLSLTAMGRQLPGNINVKNKIKKVDRLESNKHLHQELDQLYSGLSSYIFKYVRIASN